MSRFDFTEPASEGHSPIDVHVRNTDEVSVGLTDPVTDNGLTLSYWQLERIMKKIRAEYAFQLDREEAERAKDGTP